MSGEEAAMSERTVFLNGKYVPESEAKVSIFDAGFRAGDGVYEMKSEEPEEAGAKRATALSGGFLKLCEMETIEGGQNQVKFPCESSHDELIGMLMFRAQNVRAAMRESEDAASRGILAAPSQQDT